MEHRHAKLRILSSALRNLPEEWTWDFTQIMHRCGTAGCAIGFGRTIGIVSNNCPRDATPSEFYAADLGIPERAARNLFFSPSQYGRGMSKITPEMVADQIDRYIEEH